MMFSDCHSCRFCQQLLGNSNFILCCSRSPFAFYWWILSVLVDCYISVLISDKYLLINMCDFILVVSDSVLFVLVAWCSGRTSVFDRQTFPVLLLTCSSRVTIYVGKPSAVGQPTQPFILLKSIDE